MTAIIVRLVLEAALRVAEITAAAGALFLIVVAAGWMALRGVTPDDAPDDEADQLW